ncbi:MAG TPA: ABC transporter ATP-binding protein [Syntrophorhabdales bacterium]|nr:ABC transporter ATP-binding protein [Syntrophorhabdales bacterium]
MSLLEVRNIHTYYGDSHVLQGVSINVEKGKVIAILGRNGAGKTTLLRSIIGFTPPRQGNIIFKGQDITQLSIYRIVRMGIGLVPQGRRTFPSLTVKENLDIAAQGGSNARWSINEIFSTFTNLEKRSSSRARTLSGGEQQMLACGRALMGNPDLLLMDEPTEGLSPLLVREVHRIIKEIKAQELSLLLVDQDSAFALKIADYVYIMSRGAIVWESEPEKLRENPEIRSRYLGV